MEHGANINIVDKDGQTALMVACYDDFDDIVALLLDNGADMNIVDERGQTFLAVDYGLTKQ